MRSLASLTTIKFLRITLILLALFITLIGSAGAEETAVSPWVYGDREYRMFITVDANGFARTNKVIEYDLDFGNALTDLGAVGTFDKASIRVAEVNSSGGLINSEVPFQFDNGDSATNPIGTLVFLMDGTTSANDKRYFQVYFDTSGSFTSPAAMTDLVDKQEDNGHRGQQSFIIYTKDNASTINAAYYYHIKGGGFASIYDRDGNDWISYYKTEGSESAGEYRGIPNLGDVFHPGYNDTTGSSMKSRSSVIEDGPLRLSIVSESWDYAWKVRWDIFPTYARMTVLNIPTNEEYWFLYEGTPGGELDYTGNNEDKDFIVRSDDSNKAPVNTTWLPSNQELSASSLNAQGEWAYLGDIHTDRIFFLAHNNDDTLPDSYRYQYDNGYWPPSNPESSDNGAMTVFGFGRKTTTGVTRYLTAVNATFTIGFGEGSEFNSSAALIHGASQEIVVTVNNEAPTVTTNSGLTVNEGNTAVLSASKLSTSDPEGGQITYQITSAPTNGTLYLSTDPLTTNDTFTQDDIDDSLLTYVHNGGESTSDSFALLPKDRAQSADEITVLITVNGINDAPVANADVQTAVSALGLPTIIDVLANDTDVDNSDLFIHSVTQPTHGTVSINDDETISYTPTRYYEGMDSFAYQVTDGGIISESTTVTITVEQGILIFVPLVQK